MIEVLSDTNIILDIALERYPYFKNSRKIFILMEEGKFTGYVTASLITDIYFISKKESNHKIALHFISDLVKLVEIIGIDKKVIRAAFEYNMTDFEDAVQISAAEFSGMNCIVTRNKKDFVDVYKNVFDSKECIKPLN